MENAQISPTVLRLAQKAVREMIAEGQPTKQFAFGRGNNNYFWVSNGADKIIGPEEIDVDGKIFYMGMFLAQ